MDTHISFVISYHDSGTHGDLLGRLNAAWSENCRLAKMAGLAAELVIVQWNPTYDVTTRLRISPVSMPIRIITVTNALHQLFPNPYRQDFFEYIAKSVGIRRSRGKYVLSTNADSLWSPELAARFAGEFDEDSFYRIDRHDVKRPGAVPFEVKRADEKSKAGLHFNASGDFLLMSRANWFKLRGHPELPYDGTIDGQTVHAAHLLGLKQVVLPEILFHIDHVRGFRSLYSAEWSDAQPFGLPNEHETWGLGDAELPETCKRTDSES